MLHHYAFALLEQWLMACRSLQHHLVEILPQLSFSRTVMLWLGLSGRVA
jgi:hypothetical protein